MKRVIPLAPGTNQVPNAPSIKLGSKSRNISETFSHKILDFIVPMNGDRNPISITIKRTDPRTSLLIKLFVLPGYPAWTENVARKVACKKRNYSVNKDDEQIGMSL
jgi:hypothetical protein